MDALQEALRARILELDEVSEAKSRFGGALAFRRGKREFAHFHPEAEIDIRLPRKEQRSLGEDPRAVPRPRPSDWIAYRLDDEDAVARAAELVRLAYEAAG